MAHSIIQKLPKEAFDKAYQQAAIKHVGGTPLAYIKKTITDAKNGRIRVTGVPLK